MTEQFLSWRRPALSTLIPADAPAPARLLDGRIKADFPLVLDDGEPLPAPIPFVFAGPHDVRALHPGAVTARRPAPGAQQMEITHAPYVELGAADLPWRYSPVANTDAGVRPWLVLLVGESGTELRVGDGQVSVSGPALDAHRLHLSAAWAHVHRVPAEPGRPSPPDVARIIAPRTYPRPTGGRSPLTPDTDFTCALVPAWALRDGRLEPSWPAAGNTSVTMTCFDSWTFHTIAEDDDFEMIVGRLEPLAEAEVAAVEEADVGLAAVDLGVVGPGTLSLGGAITDRSGPASSPLPGAVARATSEVAQFQNRGERWVLGPPRYDDPWTERPGRAPDPEELEGWRLQLHQDPRHRGVAGLGAWAGIAWQDRIVDAAAAQAGAIALAAEKLRQLNLGLQASRSQWRRRVPVEPGQAVAVLAPMLGRLPTSETTTMLDSFARSGATWLTPALLSSAARRMLRPRSAAVRQAAKRSARLPRLLAAAATTCPAPPPPPSGQEEALEQLQDEATAASAASTLAELADDLVTQGFSAIAAANLDHPVRRPAGWLHIDPPAGSAGSDLVVGSGSGGTFDGPTLTATGGTSSLTLDGVPHPDQGGLAPAVGRAAREVVGTLVQAARPASRCRPLDRPAWTAVSEAITAGVDPRVARPVVVDRVLDGFEGLREPVLAPPDFAPELDVPLWSFLRDHAPDWLLPGAGAVPLDRVMGLATNPEFVDAFMVGANQQTLAELRRRNLPVTAGWTPLRRFWQRIDGQGPATDIAPVLDLLTDPPPGHRRWTDGSALGDPGHQRDGGGGHLIALLHTELFRRYPATQVYLVRRTAGDDDWDDLPAVGDPGTHVEPALSGTLHPELVFFGFPLTPAAAAEYWLVLEEPPPGYRFKEPPTEQVETSMDGGRYAAHTHAAPVRAFFGNLFGELA